MSDPFTGFVDGVTAPATRGAAVAPHDQNALAQVPKALFVGTGGDLVLRGMNDSTDVTFRNVPAGSVLPYRARFVRATGTTAANIVALY